MNNGKCLTHGLKFKTCSFDEYWILDDEFYWNIFKVENTSYLDGLRKLIDDKTKHNESIKENQFIKTSECPKKCLGNDCLNNVDSDSYDSSEVASTQSSQPVQQIPLIMPAGVEKTHHMMATNQKNSSVPHQTFQNTANASNPQIIKSLKMSAHVTKDLINILLALD